MKFVITRHCRKAHGNGNCAATSAQPVAHHLVAVARCHHALPPWSNFASWMPLRSKVSALVVPPAARAGMRAGRAGALAVATLSRGHFCRHLSAASGCAFAAQTCRVAASCEATTLTSALALQDALVTTFLGEGGRLAARGRRGLRPPNIGRGLGAAQVGVAAAAPLSRAVMRSPTLPIVWRPLARTGRPVAGVSVRGNEH